MDLENDLCFLNNITTDVDVVENRGRIISVPKRYIRDCVNPIEFYGDMEFRRRFRFDKESLIRHIMPLLNSHLTRDTKRGLPIPPLLCVLAALRFYATGCFQTVCGDLVSISQPTICRIVLRISKILCSHVRQAVKFPLPGPQSSAVHQSFYAIAGMPQVIGCIDGTHIPINNPGGPYAEVYRNRKSYFSVNVQVVGGPNLEIFDIVARWPGREHDSRIFNSSSVKIKLEEGLIQGILLGDSAYASEPYLLTPISNPTPNSPDERYNKAQIKTRNSVERLFGVWKKRFPCLQKTLGNKIKNVPTIIVACAVLHNVAIKYKDPEPPIIPQRIMPQPNETQNSTSVSGFAVRRGIILRHFS
ncbi:putative nuclease HARBI1 [Bicyclus anynana]|uniref:Nuclease HARBI1 n=1 Tax=Bicyclus anynana TaxID=110368 RepID=A0A6J1P131_BICAN|nr:putative nuclease HARBI1 [Bicyclus anynana]